MWALMAWMVLGVFTNSVGGGLGSREGAGGG